MSHLWLCVDNRWCACCEMFVCIMDLNVLKGSGGNIPGNQALRTQASGSRACANPCCSYTLLLPAPPHTLYSFPTCLCCCFLPYLAWALGFLPPQCGGSVARLLNVQWWWLCSQGWGGSLVGVGVDCWVLGYEWELFGGFSCTVCVQFIILASFQENNHVICVF